MSYKFIEVEGICNTLYDYVNSGKMQKLCETMDEINEDIILGASIGMCTAIAIIKGGPIVEFVVEGINNEN